MHENDIHDDIDQPILPVYTNNISFEWDKNKDKSNTKKHGISFGLAITAFDDPYALTTDD